MRAFMVFLAVGFAAFGVAPGANACAIPIPRDYNRMLAADGIFVGEMVSYDTVGSTEGGRAAQAIVTYRVDEVLKGQIPVQIELLWPPINYQVAESREPQGSEIVSFVRIEYLGKEQVSREAYSVVSGPCEGSYVLSGRRQNVDAVKGWIADGIARPSELYSEAAENAARARAKAEQRIAERRAARGLPPRNTENRAPTRAAVSSAASDTRPWYVNVAVILLGLAVIGAAIAFWKLDREKP